MSFVKAPLRYLFNKSVEAAFNTSASSPASSTAGPSVVDADTQSDDAAFYRQHQPGFSQNPASRHAHNAVGGRFKPQYTAPLHHPHDDAEAQRLYNHIRTVAWYLDALPLLGKGLPFNLGVDSILGFIPGLGDYLGLLLGVYQIYLCSLFGLPIQVLAWMVLNVIIDCFLGLIPLVGDLLDVAFKANLRNLKFFEDHLRQTRGKCGAGHFYLEFPSNGSFIPARDRGQRSGGWFSWLTGKVPQRQEGSTQARSTATAAYSMPADTSSAYRRRAGPSPAAGQSASWSDGPPAVPLALPRSLATQVDDALAEAHARTDIGIGAELSPTNEESSAEAQAKDEVEGYSIPDAPVEQSNTSQHATEPQALAPGRLRSAPSFESLEVEEPQGASRRLHSPGASAVMATSPGVVCPTASIDAEWFVSTSPEERKGSAMREGTQQRHRDRYDSVSDAGFRSEDDYLAGTSPESVAVHRRGHDPFLDLGVGSARSSLSQSRRAGSRSDATQASGLRAASSSKKQCPSAPDLSDDFKSGGKAPQRSSSQQGRRNVSWHESLSRPRSKQQHHNPFFEQDEEQGDADTVTARSSSGLASRRDRRAAETRAQWRRRRTMYFVVYSAIFCVAYITSLDANTGYLYLNFACSEYGALASFSTVAIVQQMIFAVAKPPIAKLSDVFGRAEAYVLSLVLYVSGYAIVASTRSLRSLIGGICLQSAGNTGVQVLQSIIIADTTTAKWRGLVIGIVNLPYLINFAVAGPLVDAVMRNGSWRLGYAMWTVLVPLAATPLLVTLAVGQRRARRAGLATRNPLTGKGWTEAARELARELDAVGLLLFTGGWMLILLPLTLAGHGERSEGVPPVLLFVVGAALLAGFCWWETKATAPILPYQFLANRAVICVCVVGILDFASFYISWTFLSAFIQILKGWDQTRTGYFATTQNVTSTVTGIVVGSLMAMTRRFKTLLVGGLVIRLVGVSMMIRYRNADDSTWMLVLCQLLQGIGGGSIAITMQVAVQVTVRHSDVAIVTALELLTTEIGAAMGSATAGWMLKSYLPAALAAHLPGMEREELDAVYGSLQAALKYPIGSAERSGIIAAWVQVMRYLCITATLALLPALFFGIAIPDTHLPDVHGAAAAGSVGATGAGGASSHNHHSGGSYHARTKRSSRSTSRSRSRSRTGHAHAASHSASVSPALTRETRSSWLDGDGDGDGVDDEQNVDETRGTRKEADERRPLLA
ncbi:uncharacterized protein PFL1_03018 [Pseudozyma flocculosa PF-1]|uniref:Related to siderophore iron transporter mirc n=2 Tax=Pseudozyma flocculosa TaxID=84751 RepID=A0A5C3F214_9BASI|nr:uncharacterized protein PFL1_03018 [Pseudozyma flocculosa PF-1]EPQ29263.1 hypothetical protein PFL1_03018 [Pseudozyma flocculosa PF-1]SPO37767.1 related to siderophore iron transporter mirc [Pseudozyma flocculosa]